MSYRRSLARTASFALLYGAAVLLGRKTALGPAGIGLVWPAAGVSAVWFCAQWRARARWADAVALPLVLLATTLVIRPPGVAAAILAIGVAGVVQAVVFCRLLSWLRPNLWGAGGTEPLLCTRDLWGLLGAAAGASLCGAGLGVAGEWMVHGGWHWSHFALYLTRHVAGILVVGSVGVFAGSALATFRDRYGSVAEWRRCQARMLAGTSRWRIAEYVVIIAGTTGAYLICFGYAGRLPVSFTLLGGSVLVGARLASPLVALYNVAVAGIAVRYTLGGTGPFAHVADPLTQNVIFQLFVTLVAVVGLALSLGRDERAALLAELAEEKAELAVQQTRTAAHAGLLTTIIDSMADGLAVIEADRRISLRNPAFTRLIGGATHPYADEAFGIFHLDGSRYTDDEFCYLHALAGEDVHDVDVLVRRDGGAESSIVRVTATPLRHPDGTCSAVILLHDVTAERRHRDELTNFAGVVAHDLLNPLASVDGWTVAAIDALSGLPHQPGLDEALADLARLGRAAARMRGLIDSLLAYATAREATVSPMPVDLAGLVADVADARRDAAVAAGRPEPRFVIDELPPVQADPVLLRQLLDNLIGNAIKYTAAGTTPTLTITGHRDGSMIEIRIADNGIGIPEGQHDAIFGNFHRAHPGEGYQGTGLGLAICRRIVERHHGAIRATDNPGGGTCFVFTVPAAALPALAPA
ncbi:PAS domain-containing sensor histidine kinase [Actinoplanes sp. KI2]|uniref:sensor histidine kinase n=1 Tax=Actinoplanes sp. KI2 TaxID=2983315 RepID=UPI0021D6080D|nr:PAS domain-containing sensor histidine kinase [Actinoplanes sp. KI2]MCU7724416.1 PAS domain-containing sensor histidine kinase [Actinoplanes sp. KI2]